jgi:hypothetical protein
MTTIFRSTADDSSTFRERTAAAVARSTSAADTGNLAAITKNSTFQGNQAEPLISPEKPQPSTAGQPPP